MIDAKLFASKAAKYIGTPYANPPDGLKCDSLVEKCLGDCGYKVNWDGTNTMARTEGVFAWLGTPEECKKTFGSIPVGACPMIWENNGKEPEKYRKDGIGNYSHIGIKTGTGLGAIHASYSKGGVCESKFADKTIPSGGWNRVALLGMLDYGDKINDLLYDQPEDDVYRDCIVTQDVPMYASASASSRVVRHAEAGDYVILWDDKITPTWTHISIMEIEGWIQSKYLKYVEDKGMKGKIISENGLGVNFRKKPNTSSDAYGKLPVGTMVDIEDVLTGWYKVTANGNTGYIMAEFLSVETPQPDPIHDPAWQEVLQQMREALAASAELNARMGQMVESMSLILMEGHTKDE